MNNHITMYNRRTKLSTGTLCALQQTDPSCHSLGFKFAIICSGYISAVPEHRALLLELSQEDGSKISIPSLHIFSSGQGGTDRQIPHDESTKLLNCFSDMTSKCILHDNGHLIPGDRATAEKVKEFLTQFCCDI